MSFRQSFKSTQQKERQTKKLTNRLVSVHSVETISTFFKNIDSPSGFLDFTNLFPSLSVCVYVRILYKYEQTKEMNSHFDQ